jgi:hypothetical protein
LRNLTNTSIGPRVESLLPATEKRPHEQPLLFEADGPTPVAVDRSAGVFVPQRHALISARADSWKAAFN